MTILHTNIDDDSDDSCIFATKTSTDQKKPIPQWARSKFKMNTSSIITRGSNLWTINTLKLSFFFFFSLENELQIAICNQIYFHRNPSEIFGNTIDCSPAHLRTILHSMLPNVELIDDDLHQSTSIPINSNKSILV
jgi:hypothetical protein